MDDLSWNDLGPRERDLWSPRAIEIDTGSGSSSGFRFQANSTSAFANELEFAAAKSVRTSIIILASFNAIAAAATAAGIFWDCCMSARRRDPMSRLRSSFWGIIGPAETFPFTLCCGIVAQAIVFAVAQSKGLGALIILGCTPISQSMLPATLVVPYIQIAFGVETTVRAAWRGTFPKRPKWTTGVCVAVVVMAVLATFLVTRLDQAPNFCFASLFWFIEHWAVACFGVLNAVLGTSLIAAVVIFFRLRKDARVDATERVTASWMVYFMAISVVSNTLLIPFFYNISFKDTSFAVEGMVQLSTVASVVSNLSGLLTGAMYLFLRSSRFATISPEGYVESDRQHTKEGLRVWTPGNDAYTSQIAQPVSPPAQYQRAGSRQDEAEREEQDVQSPTGTPTYEQPNPLASNAVDDATQPTRRPDTVQMFANRVSATPHRKDSTASQVVNAAVPSGKTFSLLPATAYTPATNKNSMGPVGQAMLMPPPAIHVPGGMSHRRDSSMGSSATVQIGLRLSNVNDMVPSTPWYGQEASQAHVPESPGYRGPQGPRKVSPLATKEMRVRETVDEDRAMVPSPLRVPQGMPPEKEETEDEEIRLSPSVYSPQDEPTQPRASTPLGIGHGAVTRGSRQDKKADWI